MAHICPNCGKSSERLMTYCSCCGGRMDGVNPAPLSASTFTTSGRKNAVTSGLCSLLCPGLGQVNNGEIAKGYIFLFLTLIGGVLFILPGIIIWLFSAWEAYAEAGLMNTGKIEYRESPTGHMLLFVVISIVATIAVILIVAFILLAMMIGMFAMLLGA